VKFDCTSFAASAADISFMRHLRPQLTAACNRLHKGR
jgi:hypothetical protein